MKLTVTIPEFISIKDFKKLSTLEHLDPVDKMVEIIHVFTDISRDDIKQWDISTLSQISKDLEAPLAAPEEFYPVFYFNDVLYGYSSIKKMKVSEMIDLERLCKEPMENYEQIMAILYRPITEHRLDNASFKYHNAVKIVNGETENMIKYYSIEDYDSDKRELNADAFKDFPVQLANGAIAFFLSSATLSLNSINSSLPEEEKMKTEKKILNLLRNIGGGLVPYTIYQKVPSLTLPEIKASLN